MKYMQWSLGVSGGETGLLEFCRGRGFAILLLRKGRHREVMGESLVSRKSGRLLSQSDWLPHVPRSHWPLLNTAPNEALP